MTLPEAGGGRLVQLAALSDEDLERLYAPPPGGQLRADFVSTIDGAVEIAGRSGPLGGDDDRRVFSTLRALSDVILVGSGTVLAENYGPAKLSAPRRARRAGRGQAELPPIAVVNGPASLDPHHRLFAGRGADEGGPPPIVLCAASASAERRRALRKVAEVVECGEQRVDLRLALDALAARGMASVLCEGGPTLVGALLSGGLLDQLCLSQAMMLAGPGHKMLVAGLPLVASVGLRLRHLLFGEGVLLGCWDVEAPRGPSAGGEAGGCG